MPNEFRPTGPYNPPSFVRPTFPSPPITPQMVADAHANPGDISDFAHLLLRLYPRDAAGGGRVPIVNSRAIGDRPLTTMTNPMSAYHPPTMSNTPLAGGATQMGSALAAHLQR